MSVGKRSRILIAHSTNVKVEENVVSEWIGDPNRNNPFWCHSLDYAEFILPAVVGIG